MCAALYIRRHPLDCVSPAMGRMRQEAAATEHSRTTQSSELRLAQRIAADGLLYTYTEFLNHYGADADQKWEEVAATEHLLPAQRIAPDGTPYTETQAPSSGSNEPRAAVTIISVSDLPRDATAYSPMETARSTLTASSRPEDTSEYARVVMPASSTASTQATSLELPSLDRGGLLQCVECQGPLCGTEDLAFFWRYNGKGTEVHLMLKPENRQPAAFILSPVTEQGAAASWRCACGFKLGDTRAVGVKKNLMTSFKSASVMLCGQRFPGKKSKWPAIYDQRPFNDIEVRTRATFFGFEDQRDFFQ